MASQFFATRGKRPRYDYVGAINAQGKHLPGQIATKKANQFQDKEFALKKEEASATAAHLKNMEGFEQANLSFMEKQSKRAKKDSKIANMIGLGKVGTDIYFANKASNAGPGAKALTDTLPGFQDGLPSGSPAGSAKSIMSGGLKNAPSNIANYLKPKGNLFGPGAVAGLGGALTMPNMLKGAGAGMLASNLLTDKDDKWWKKAGIGALAGGITNYATGGGDLFSSAIGAAFGGGGGLFSF
jgi:hypothetical protein